MVSCYESAIYCKTPAPWWFCSKGKLLTPHCQEATAGARLGRAFTVETVETMDQHGTVGTASLVLVLYIMLVPIIIYIDILIYNVNTRIRTNMKKRQELEIEGRLLIDGAIALLDQSHSSGFIQNIFTAAAAVTSAGCLCGWGDIFSEGCMKPACANPSLVRVFVFGRPDACRETAKATFSGSVDFRMISGSWEISASIFVFAAYRTQSMSTYG